MSRLLFIALLLALLALLGCTAPSPPLLEPVPIPASFSPEPPHRTTTGICARADDPCAMW